MLTNMTRDFFPTSEHDVYTNHSRCELAENLRKGDTSNFPVVAKLSPDKYINSIELPSICDKCHSGFKTVAGLRRNLR